MTYREEDKPKHPLGHLAYILGKAVEYQANIFRAAQDLQAFFGTICDVQDKNENLPLFTCTPLLTSNFNEKKGFWLRWSSPNSLDLTHQTKITIYGSGRIHLEIDQKRGTLQYLPSTTYYDLNPEKQPAELTAQIMNIVASTHTDIQELVRRNQQAFLDEIDSKMIVQPLGDPKPSIA